MATLVVTNLSTTEPVELTDLYTTLVPLGSNAVTSNGGVLSTQRTLSDIAGMADLLGKMQSGLVSVTITPTATELAENADTLAQVSVLSSTTGSEIDYLRTAFGTGETHPSFTSPSIGTWAYTASTTIASGSNGLSLPQATINVASTSGFPAGPGTIFVVTGAGTETVTYTSTSGGNQFTGCSGGTGLMSTTNAVTQDSITFAPTLANTPVHAGSIQVKDGSTIVATDNGSGTLVNVGDHGATISGTITYSTGVMSVTFTGGTPTSDSIVVSYTQDVAGDVMMFPVGMVPYPFRIMDGTMLVSTAQTGTASVWTQAGGTGVEVGTFSTSSTGRIPITYTGNVTTLVNPVVPTTTIASGSGGATLPQGTINVASTTGFPSTGTINIVLAGGSTTVAAGSNNTFLPQSTINVVSTTGFSSSGSITVQTNLGPQTVFYSGTTATSFTGCSQGLGRVLIGYAVTSASSTQAVAYTGTSGGNQFTGCTGGTGTMATGDAVNGSVGLFLHFTDDGAVGELSLTIRQEQ